MKAIPHSPNATTEYSIPFSFDLKEKKKKMKAKMVKNQMRVGNNFCLDMV